MVTQRDKKLVSLETENQICNMYQNNMLICQISKQLNVERHTVVRALKRCNLYDPKKSKKHLDDTRIIRNQQVCTLSMQGYSHRQIAKMLSIGKSNINYILKNSIDFIPLETGRYDYRAKKMFNERFFQVIDTEEKAYWLGFLYADGCVTNKAVRLEISIKDRKHLEKFKDILQYQNAHFYFRKDIESILLHMNSSVMVQDLEKLGCVKKKTYILQFPNTEQVPLSLIHHFMRGYFDGDGCIYVHPKLYSISTFSLVGTLDFLQRYQEVLNQGICKTTTNKIYSLKSQNIGSISFGGSLQVKKIYDFLYHDATLYLERKKEKFDIVISRLNVKSTRKR